MTKRGTCKVSICDRDYFAKGYCQPHYSWARRRDFKACPFYQTRKTKQLKEKESTSCLVSICDRPVKRGEYCNPHYQYALKHNFKVCPFYVVGTRNKRCTVKNCSRDRFANRLCSTHHKQDRFEAKFFRRKHRRPSREREKLSRWLVVAFKSGGCVDCGQVFPTYVIDLDHVWGEKNVRMSETRRHSIEQFVWEVGKCEPVCANCHRIRTFSTRDDWIVSC